MKNVWVLVQLLGAGFVIGAFFTGTFTYLFIIGLILVFFGGYKYREESRLIECPKCKERIKKDAEKCRFCGAPLK